MPSDEDVAAALNTLLEFINEQVTTLIQTLIGALPSTEQLAEFVAALSELEDRPAAPELDLEGGSAVARPVIAVRVLDLDLPAPGAS